MAGRPQAPRSISNNVMPRNQLQLFHSTPLELYGEMNDPMRWLTWLAEHRLIRNTNDCAVCQQGMTLVRRAEAPEGFSWRCRGRNTRASVRTGSFFARCVLGIDSWHFFRAECVTWLNTQQVHLGGFDGNGQPMYVEVNDTYYFHVKYHRGCQIVD